MGRAEAVGIVRGWMESGTRLRLELHVGPALVALFLRARTATADAWQFVGEDGVTGLTLRLGAGFMFDFHDIQDLPNPSEDFAAMLTVIFGVDPPAHHGHVAIAALREAPTTPPTRA